MAILSVVTEERLHSNIDTEGVLYQFKSENEVVLETKEQITEINEEVDVHSMLHIRNVGDEDLRILEEVKIPNLHAAEEVKVSDEVKVVVDTEHVVNVVEDFYISFNIDSYIFESNVRWLKFNFRLVQRCLFRMISRLCHCPWLLRNAQLFILCIHRLICLAYFSIDL